MLAAIEGFPLPVVAVVQGDAIAGGNELALHCDFVVASTSCPFRHVARSNRHVDTWFLTKKLLEVAGPVATRRILLLGEPLAGSEMHRLASSRIWRSRSRSRKQRAPSSTDSRPTHLLGRDHEGPHSAPDGISRQIAHGDIECWSNHAGQRRRLEGIAARPGQARAEISSAASLACGRLGPEPPPRLNNHRSQSATLADSTADQPSLKCRGGRWARDRPSIAGLRRP